MPDDTTILSLPLILPAQAQKHVTHNEALVALDLIVQLTVIDRTLTAPPALPAVGDRHIVAVGATGDWTGQAGRIALYSDTGWQFTPPLAGWRAHVLAEGQTAVFDGLAWKTLADGPLSVAQLGVATTADAVNRLAVAAPATLLTHAGGGHQLKLNKAAPGDTASLLFQTGFSGRAEMGTAGTDDFLVKVSADGSSWSTALTADAATGAVTLPQPLRLGGQAGDPANPADGTLWLNTASGEVRVRSAGVTLPVGGGGGGGVADGDKGDITVSGGGTVWTIDAGAVGLAEMADLPQGAILGRATAGAGAPEALTVAQATALLDTFASGAKGLVPASGGGTANYLRADGTWVAPPVGGSPGGSSGEVQFNGGGAFAGAADVAIEGGQLRLPAIGVPAAPAAGGLKLFGREVAGRIMPAFVGPSGLTSPLQPLIARNKVRVWAATGNGGTDSQVGFSIAGTGSVTAVNWAGTNFRTQMSWRGWHVTTAATSAVVGARHNASMFTIGGNAANRGGFYLSWIFSPAIGVANASHRLFVGLRASTAAPTDVDPSGVANHVGVGYDAADTNMQIMHRDGASGTKIDLGTSFPKPSANAAKVYRLEMFSPPGTTQSVGYLLTDLDTGETASGTVTTHLPGTATALNVYSQMSVGGVSSVVGLDHSLIYMETDQ